MSSRAIEAVVAASKPGADATKVANIWRASTRNDMKNALAAMLSSATVAVPPTAIDDTDADNLLAAKVNIPTGGVVPLY